MPTTNQLSTKPEHMLPVMIVLGVMFVGICIAMNLFSRARFKKRRNVFAAAAARTAAQQKRNVANSYRSAPGGGQRLSSSCASPIPPSMNPLNHANHSNQPQPSSPSKPPPLNYHSVVDESGRTSVLSVA